MDFSRSPADGFGGRRSDQQPTSIDQPYHAPIGAFDQPYGDRTLGATTDGPVQLDRGDVRGDEAGAGDPTTVRDTAAHGISGAGGALPHLDAIQRSFGHHDVSGVQAHTDGAAQASNDAMGAQGFATGNHVAFAGAPSLHTAAHEAAHVVQQRAGVQLKAEVGAADHPSEREADAVADRVTAGESAEDLLDQTTGGRGRRADEARTPGAAATGDVAPAGAADAAPAAADEPAAEGDAVQMKFDPAKVKTNSHLRDGSDWKTHVGPQITSGSQVLVDTAHPKKEKKTIGSETWIPAVNVAPTSKQKNVAPDHAGYIRASHVSGRPTSFEDILEQRVTAILKAAELRHACTRGFLATPENVAFLVDKAIRLNAWNGDQGLATFVSGFGAKEDKLQRIEDGANYVSDSLEHWRQWLHPNRLSSVKLTKVKLLQSDLHEHGLGVLDVTFTKPRGPKGHKFAAETKVDLIIKPEDKSLEGNLLGDDDTSAVNQINKVVGLTDPKEKLTSIRMACTATHGSIVEKIKGTKAEDIAPNSVNTIDPVFHETLVFAFLAGIDDLHKENVYWKEGRPYLIDADNVLSSNQMRNKDNGAINQSGFDTDDDTMSKAATDNKQAISSGDNKVNSKLLKTMIEDKAKALKIIDIIKGAVAGKQGRVVPIRTSAWGQILRYYPSDNNGFLDMGSSKAYLVREKEGFDTAYGPGMYGVVAKNKDKGECYPSAANERAELKKDFDAGVIPFYNYDYDTGAVSHNGAVVYHGQTAAQAMQVLIDKFSPEWDRRFDEEWQEYMSNRNDEI